MLGGYAVTLDPLLSLYGIIYVSLVYQPPTETYWSQIPVAFSIPSLVVKHLPDTSVRQPKTELLSQGNLHPGRSVLGFLSTEAGRWKNTRWTLLDRWRIPGWLGSFRPRLRWRHRLSQGRRQRPVEVNSAVDRGVLLTAVVRFRLTLYIWRQ